MVCIVLLWAYQVRVCTGSKDSGVALLFHLLRRGCTSCTCRKLCATNTYPLFHPDVGMLLLPLRRRSPSLLWQLAVPLPPPP